MEIKLRNLLGLVFFVGSMQLQAATYYISPSGNDTNSGLTTNLAWKTISKVNGLTLHPGDKVLFEGGKIFSGNLVFDASDAGSPTNAVQIGSYGPGGRAVIKAGLGNGLYASNCAGMVIDHINFTGLGSTTNNGAGITFFMNLTGGKKLDYIRISYVDTYGFGKEGIGFYANDLQKSGYRDVQLDHVSSHDNKLYGARTFGSWTTNATTWSHENFVVRYSKFYKNSGDPLKTDNHSGNGLLLEDINGALIEHCLAYSNGWLCNFPKAGPCGLWACDGNKVVIQYNESHHNFTGTGRVDTGDGDGFDLDAGIVNSVMQYNYSHDNDGAGYLLCHGEGYRSFSNNIVRYNISQNDGRRHRYGAVTVYNGTTAMKNCHIFNNTIFVDATVSNSAVNVRGKVSNMTFRDNILMSTNGATLVWTTTTSGLTFQGNDYWTFGGPTKITWGTNSYSSVTSWASAKGQERLNGTNVYLNVNPLLADPGNGPTFNDVTKLTTLNAYKLLSNSTLINKALALKTLFGVDPGTRDFYGNTVPLGGAADVGANELR